MVELQIHTAVCMSLTQQFSNKKQQEHNEGLMIGDYTLVSIFLFQFLRWGTADAEIIAPLYRAISGPHFNLCCTSRVRN